jgi:ATP-binding cassette subfamily F protein uup
MRINEPEMNKSHPAIVKTQETSKQTSENNPSVKKKPSFNEKREFELLEKEIAALSEEKSQISVQLSDPDVNYQTIENLSKRFSDITDLLDEKELRWLELSELF